MTNLTRRAFLGSAAYGIGAAALSSLAAQEVPRFAPRAKRVIFLFQFGGPSQFETFDYKPGLGRWHGTDLPASVRAEGEISGLTRGQKSLPVAAPFTRFARHGRSGLWVSELLPHTARLA